MENIQQLINDYKEIGSLEKVALKNNVGKKKAKKLLLENNIQLNQKGSQVKFNVQKFPKIQPQNPENKIVAICKQTGKQFNDPNDRSGAIKKYIEQELQIQYPSLNERRKYYSINKSYWFEQYFIIKEIPKETTRKCKKCGWETKDIHNKTGAFEVHIKNHHDEYNSIEDYLNEFPEDRIYHPTIVKKQNYKKELNDPNKHINCKICGRKFKKVTETHLRTKHGITLPEYKEKYGQSSSNELIENSKQKIYYNVNKWGHTTFSSKAEQEIKSFITDELFFECDKKGNRSLLDGMEIDGQIKNTNICFEYNGNRWHTEKFGKNKWYHLNKTKACLDQGFKLLHIFEDEWKYKKNIVKDIFKHKLNIKERTIYARNTKICDISMETKNKFLNNNHIQGEDKSSIYFGAYYNDELIGIMAFKRRKNEEFELSRVAIKLGLHSPGLISKLLKYFTENYDPTKIITFADRRFTPNKTENLYTKLNFKLVKVLNPDYKYFHPKRQDVSRHHKFGFRKQHLIRQYGFNSSMTEKEMTEALGYERIWDCGLLKYEIK